MVTQFVPQKAKFYRAAKNKQASPRRAGGAGARSAKEHASLRPPRVEIMLACFFNAGAKPPESAATKFFIYLRGAKMLAEFNNIEKKFISKVIKSVYFHFYPNEIQIDIMFTSPTSAKVFQMGLPAMFKGKMHGTSRITNNMLTIKIK
ncbi:MAG: hypothetical protein IT312_08640 [Anaerolineales bacterium]|nr:hypothetical protein [Anaerolineales bacterium]